MTSIQPQRCAKKNPSDYKWIRKRSIYEDVRLRTTGVRFWYNRAGIWRAAISKKL